MGDHGARSLLRVLGNFPDEREVLTRERASDSYSMLSWYVTKVIAELPFFWTIPFGFFCIICPMTSRLQCTIMREIQFARDRPETVDLFL